MKEVKFNFEELRVYDKSLEFVEQVYAITKKFPTEERFRLTSQFIRAATSIALNIAEGSGDTDAQFNRFLKIAEGSIRECVVCSTIAKTQGFITNEDDNTVRLSLTSIAKMITNLRKYLK